MSYLQALTNTSVEFWVARESFNSFLLTVVGVSVTMAEQLSYNEHRHCEPRMERVVRLELILMALEEPGATSTPYPHRTKSKWLWRYDSNVQQELQKLPACQLTDSTSKIQGDRTRTCISISGLNPKLSGRTNYPTPCYISDTISSDGNGNINFPPPLIYFFT